MRKIRNFESSMHRVPHGLESTCTATSRARSTSALELNDFAILVYFVSISAMTTILAGIQPGLSMRRRWLDV